MSLLRKSQKGCCYHWFYAIQSYLSFPALLNLYKGELLLCSVTFPALSGKGHTRCIMEGPTSANKCGLGIFSWQTSVKVPPRIGRWHRGWRGWPQICCSQKATCYCRLKIAADCVPIHSKRMHCLSHYHSFLFEQHKLLNIAVSMRRWRQADCPMFSLIHSVQG